MDNINIQAASTAEDAAHGSQVLDQAASCKRQAQATSLPQLDGKLQAKQKGKRCK